MKEHRWSHQFVAVAQFIALVGAVLMLVMVVFPDTRPETNQTQRQVLEVTQTVGNVVLKYEMTEAPVGVHCQIGATCGIEYPAAFALPVSFDIAVQSFPKIPGWNAFPQPNGLFRPPRSQA